MPAAAAFYAGNAWHVSCFCNADVVCSSCTAGSDDDTEDCSVGLSAPRRVSVSLPCEGSQSGSMCLSPVCGPMRAQPCFISPSKGFVLPPHPPCSEHSPPSMGLSDASSSSAECGDAHDTPVLRRGRHSQSMENIVDLLLRADSGVLAEMLAEMCVEGTGGVYFVRDPAGDRVGVFKPEDEEGGEGNNPHGNSAAVKDSIPSGQGWRREIAAYRLDHRHFAGVPETFQMCIPGHVVGAKGDKVGSFQRFVYSNAEAWDVMPASLPTQDIHRIATLDIRLCNADRHGGNILVCGDKLVPIDHGCCIPLDLTELEFEWMLWSQSKLPVAEDILQYVEGLDAEADAEVLVSELGFPQRAADNVRAATLLLQEGLRSGLTLFDVASLMRRPRLNTPSALELLLHDCLGPLDAGATVNFDLLTPRIPLMVAEAVREKAATGSVCP